MSETDVRAHVSILATPGRSHWIVRCSSDAIRVRRTAGRVTGSARDPSANEAVRPVLEAAEATLDRLRAALSASDVQSVVIRATNGRVEALARIECPCGPVVLGGRGPNAAEELIAAASELLVASFHPGPPSHPGQKWGHRPLMVGPGAVAVVLVAARWLLGSPSARALQHRRLLPDVSLVDRPVEHEEGDSDDAGHPAARMTLVDHGRITLPEPGGDPPPGRACWLHDTQRLGSGAGLDLTLSAVPTMQAPPGRLQLVCVVEGLRRYYNDGIVRLSCIARTDDDPRCFRLWLRGNPLAMLRAVRAGCGVPRTVFSEHAVTTPALLLPSASQLSTLKGNNRVSVSPL
jgi:hypothetical protein